MGKASSSKKVARAASTGGGRTNRGRTPILYYGVLLIIAALGITGIAVSRGTGAAQANVAPIVNKDHWHAAFGFYLCDKFAPAPQDKTTQDLYGIHTHGDGLVHIHPFSSVAAGKNATLKWIIDDIGATLTKTKLSLPGQKSFKNGDKCGTKVGQVQVVVWDSNRAKTSKPVAGDPKSLRLKQGELITVAFVPVGTTIPKPPSSGSVNSPSDGSSPQTATSLPTTESSSATSTTAPPSSSTTATTAK
jgi:hypothetical protein